MSPLDQRSRRERHFAPLDAQQWRPILRRCHSVTQALYLQSKSGEWPVHYVVTHGTALRLGMVPMDWGFAKCKMRQDRIRNAQAEAVSRLYILDEKPLPRSEEE